MESSIHEPQKPSLVSYEDFMLGVEALLRGQGSFTDEEADRLHCWLAELVLGEAMLHLLRRAELNLSIDAANGIVLHHREAMEA